MTGGPGGRGRDGQHIFVGKNSLMQTYVGEFDRSMEGMDKSPIGSLLLSDIEGGCGPARGTRR